MQMVAGLIDSHAGGRIVLTFYSPASLPLSLCCFQTNLPLAALLIGCDIFIAASRALVAASST